MADLSEIIGSIRNARLARDVRGAIADGFEELRKLEEKLRIRSKKLNNLLADGKDVYDKKEWKYYRKAITEDCPKPYWRNI